MQNRPFTASHSRGTKQPRWIAKVALWQDICTTWMSGCKGPIGCVRLVNKWRHQKYAQMRKIAHYVIQPTRELFVLAEVSCDIIYLFTTAALPTQQNVQNQRNFTCHHIFVFSWCYFGYLPASELQGLERHTTVTWLQYGRVPCEPELHLWCSCSAGKRIILAFKSFKIWGSMPHCPQDSLEIIVG